MTSAPGTCGEMKDHLKRTGGRPQTEGKAEKVKKCVDLRLKGKTLGQIVKETGFAKTTVDRWLFEYDQNNGTDGAQA